MAEKLRVAVIISDATHMVNTGADLDRRVRVFDLPDEVSAFIRRNQGEYTTIALALEDPTHDA